MNEKREKSKEILIKNMNLDSITINSKDSLQLSFFDTFKGKYKLCEYFICKDIYFFQIKNLSDCAEEMPYFILDIIITPIYGEKLNELNFNHRFQTLPNFDKLLNIILIGSEIEITIMCKSYEIIKVSNTAQ